MDKGQKMRYSKDELSLLRNTFKDDDVLLFKIRNVMYGFSDEAPEMHPDLEPLIEKTFLPELTPDVPLGQQADLYFALSKIKEIPPEVAEVHLEAQDLAIRYVRGRLDILLKKPMSVDLFSLEALRKPGEKRVERMLAYLFLTNNFIDSSVSSLKILANTDTDTLEGKKKNSNK